MKKRVLSLFLIVVMLFTMCPVTVSAADDVVYLSVSLDESYIEGSSSPKIVQMPISLSAVAAVDLDKYKLGDYAKDEYGNDISTEPTLLKLFIYAHENIYNGSWNDVTVSGEPLAIYFQEGLFGFSANVNYYVNGEYQYFDKPGAFGGGFHEIGCSCGSCYAMGKTADAYVLTAGDYVDVAGFTGYNSGVSFSYFIDNSDVVRSYTATVEEPLEVNLSTYTTGWDAGTVEMTPESGRSIHYSQTPFDSDAAFAETDDDGMAVITFSEGGAWYLWSDGYDPGTGNYVSPAYAVVEVEEPEPTVYQVTLPEDPVGYTVTGETDVTEGADYTFTVAVDEGYDGTNMVVKVNGETVTGETGSYTIEKVSEALSITVEGVVEKAAEPDPGESSTGVTMETGAEAFGVDRVLSIITIQGVSGTASGADTSWAVELDKKTDMTQPLTFELTALLGSYVVANAGSCYLWVNETSSEKSLGEYDALKGTVTVMPTWENGQFTAVVGVGSASKLNGTKYTIKLSVAGQVQENPNEIELGEGSAKKYFVEAMTVDGPTVTERSVTGADFSGSTSGHKATVNIKLAENSGLTFDLVLEFMTTDGAYLTVNGGDRAEALDGVYTAAINLNDRQQYTFVTYSSNSNSTVRGTYTVNFSVEGLDLNKAPTLTGESSVQQTLDQYAAETLDLSTVFNDLNGDDLTYWVSVNGGELQEIGGSVYTYNTDEAGDFTLAFYAKDYAKTSPAYTVTLQVDEIERYTIMTGDTGDSLLGVGTVTEIYIDYQKVASSNWLRYDDNSRTIAIRLDSTVADNAQLEINYRDKESRPSLTPSNPIQLADGKASVVLTTQGHSTWYKTSHTYNIYISKSANTAPALCDGVNAVETAEMLAGETYTLDLASVFTDADNDALRYTVQIDSGEAEALDSAVYSLPKNETGTYTLLFTAQDVWGETVTHTVTLTVGNAQVTYDVTVNVPSGVTPAFYPTTGYNADSEDIFAADSALTAVPGTEADGYVPYTVKVPENISTISFRDTAWGGMSIPVSANAEFTLEKFSGFIDHKQDGAYMTTAQALFRVRDNDGNYAVSGGSAVDETGMTYYRFLLAATGNDATYTLSTQGIGDLAAVYSENIVSAFALEPNGETSKKLPMTVAGALTITAPADAEFKLFRQQNNYNTKEVAPVSTSTADGITTYVFNHPGTNVTWRASCSGKITKAGYLGRNQTELNVAWDDSDPAPDVQVGNSVSSELAQRHDASAVVNVNSQNHLVLNSGDTFRLRGYRWWQIIDTDTNNIMIEPDFHYDIVTGSDVIGIDAKDGGNASGNWMDITANGTGTAVVEVGFDAIHVSGTSYIDNFTFGACDPDRTALVVVSVGEETDDVDFGIVHNNKYSSWDAEFSTLYFLEEQGSLTFTPDAEGTVSVSHDKGKTWQPLTGTDGTYTAPIVSGGNILKIETASGTDYQVVRGAQVSVTLREQTGDGDNIIEAGETVRVALDGLHHNISKMSGIYNPGYGGGVNVSYVAMKEGANVGTVNTNHGQYHIATGVSFKIPGDAVAGDVFTLTNGYLNVTGPGSGPGAHRDINDGGVGTNTSAGNGAYAHGNLPDIIIRLGAQGAANQAPSAKADAPTTASIEAGKNYAINPETLFTDPDGDTLTYKVSVNGGDAETISADYKYMPVSAGTYTLKFTATDPDGETAEHTITLTATAVPGDTDKTDFGLTEEQIAGYVTVSFEDKGIRPEGATGLKFPVALGTIIEETEVPYAEGDNVAAVTVRLLNALDIGHENSGSIESGFYLSAIKNFEVDNTPYEKMGEYDAGSGSGWMITLNDVFINRGTSDFTVKSGDVIKWQYTCQLGADIGDTATMVNVTLVNKGEVVLAQQEIPVYNHNDNTIIDVDDVLYAAHNAHYTGGADAGYTTYMHNQFGLSISKLWGDTSGNFGYWVNNDSCMSPEDGVNNGDHLVVYVMEGQSDAYAHFDSFTYTAAAGTALPVTVKYVSSYDSETYEPVLEHFANAAITAYDSEMNALAADAYTVTNNNDGTYAVTFKNAGSYYLVARSADNSIVLVPAVAKVTCAPDTSGLTIDAIYEATAETLLETKVGTGSTNGEWLMFGLARALDKNPTAEQKSDHLAAVKSFISANIKADGKLHENKATENQRIALALTALGYDASAFEGKDLLKALTDTAWVTNQGNNSTAFALLTINAAGYDASNELALLSSLRGNQQPNGAWSISGDEDNSDTTAMAVQALAPYYDTDASAKAAVDKALTYLAGRLNNKGQIVPEGHNPSAENTAQVIVALCELGRDPANNAQFTKNGKTLLDGLKSFYLEEEKGFAHEYGQTDRDPMATEQSFYAMVAYKRLLAKTASLYDMSDYNITVVEPSHGTVEVAASATADSVVTITLNPAVGYTVDKVYVGSTAIDVTYSNNVYTAAFTMPASDVVISASFKLGENASAELQAAMAALTNDDVKDADEGAYELLGEIEAAITALNLSESELATLKDTDAYKNYAAKVEKFQEERKELIDKAEDDLDDLFKKYDEKDYTEKNWKEIEDIYEDALEALEEAPYAEEIEEILEDAEDAMDDVPVGGALEVTFRLIGDFKHDDGVSDHGEYVTWIETTEYTLDAGATMYDLFMMAIDDFDLNQKGAKNNYVESIQAPDCLGGYWIGEFDNGRNSGWMYTIDGKHPGTGLVYQELEDGDEVIWHYVDDYTKEERNSSSQYYERWLEARDISPEKYVERTIGEIVTVGKNGEVKPALDIDDIGKDITFKFQPDNGYVVKDVIIDGESMGAIESYTYKDLSIDSRIEVTFVPAGMEDILTVSKNGSAYPALELDDLGKNITFTFVPDAGYVVGNVIVDGKSVGAVTSYTYKNLSLESRIEVVFALADEITFADVADGIWYAEAVQYVAANGFFSGTGNGSFSPNTTMSRAMMVTVLHNMAQNPTAYNANLFGDVAAGAWYDEAVRWATANGIASGYPGGKFGTNDDVTREQIAVFLYNYAKAMGYDVNTSVSLASYADDETVSTYAKTAMQWAVAEGIISGRSGNKLAAKSNASRAEVATMICNFAENVAK